MTATDRRDRHALDKLLYKMRKEGQVVSAGRGRYLHPDPFKPVEIVEKGPSEEAAAAEPVDNSDHSPPDESLRGSLQDLYGADPVEIPVEIPETSKPLANNGNV